MSTNDVTSASGVTVHDDAADDKTAQWQLVSDGGMIALSFMMNDVTTWRAMGAERLGADRLNADLLGSGRLDAIKSLDSVNFAIRNDAISLLSGSIAHEVFGGKVDLSEAGGLVGQGWSPAEEFDLFDSPSGGEYEMNLNDTELANGSANGDIAVIPPPTEQPGLNGGSEGGQIALSPFVAPTGLTLSDGQSSSSLARVGPAGEPLGVHTTPTTSGATRAEGLRGRAVVYEVADAEDAAAVRAAKQIADGSEPTTEELVAAFKRAGDAALNADHAGDIVRTQATPAADARSDAEAPLDVEAAIASLSADLHLNGAITLAALGVNFNPSFNGENADGRDAAFADWKALDPHEQDGPQDELAAPTAVNDRRMLGLGVAMALTVVPLRKAWRRRGATPVERQLSPELPSARHDD